MAAKTTNKEPNDERKIRTLIEEWISASGASDLPKMLSLMADDVLFMVPGQEPFGKKEFAARFQAMEGAHVVGKSEIKEISVMGEEAWCRTYLSVAITAPGEAEAQRAGYTLSILRKTPDGRWLLARDANLLSAR